ncbi:MAG: hypothetical protein JRI25_27540 [Deltaproteobacteria bacterium]|nr:hypothetical protein [Deltaproteobacteria bacterium]
MRPFIVSLVVLIAAGGCTEPTNSSAFEPEYTLRVFGDFERLNPADRDSVWVGVEHTRIVDNQGTLVCEDVLDTEAWEIEDPDADLSLEMAREGIADLVPDCTRVYADEMSRITGQRYLSFVASHSGSAMPPACSSTARWPTTAPGGSPRTPSVSRRWAIPGTGSATSGSRP